MGGWNSCALWTGTLEGVAVLDVIGRVLRMSIVACLAGVCHPTRVYYSQHWAIVLGVLWCLLVGDMLQCCNGLGQLSPSAFLPAAALWHVLSSPDSPCKTTNPLLAVPKQVVTACVPSFGWQSAHCGSCFFLFSVFVSSTTVFEGGKIRWVPLACLKRVLTRVKTHGRHSIRYDRG